MKTAAELLAEERAIVEGCDHDNRRFATMDHHDYYELEAQGGANVCPRCAKATPYNPTDPHDGERLCAACTEILEVPDEN